MIRFFTWVWEKKSFNFHNYSFCIDRHMYIL